MTSVTQHPTPVPERAQRSDAVRNRKRVIKAARVVMARDGLDAQMDEIARRAQVGVGTVYRHFPTKDDLIEALAAERFERLAELAEQALAAEDPRIAFEQFIRASAKIQSEDRALSEVLTSRPGTMGRAAESVGILELTAKIMRRAQDAGAVRKDADPRDVPMFMCALAGTFSGPYTSTDRYIGIVLDGLRGTGAAPTKLPPVKS
jgi:AcrR family transcriptional regulator